MNIQKFTQKSIEAINDCEKLAYEYGNQELEQEHLMVALLRQEDGLILKLIEKMEINKEENSKLVTIKWSIVKDIFSYIFIKYRKILKNCLIF